MSGFTGQLTDSAGRKRKYVDGKPVRLDAPPQPHQDAAATHEPSAPSRGVSAPPHPSRRRQALQQLAAWAGGAESLEHGASEWFDRQMQRLPKVLSLPVRGVLHASFASYRAATSAVRAVAKERGLSEEQSDRVAKACAVADIVLGAKGLPMAIKMAGGGPAMAIAGGFFPIGSISYIAYSSARDPVSVLRAARKGVMAAMKRGVTKSLDLTEIADRKPSELWLAAFLVALDETGSKEHALRIADEVGGGEMQTSMPAPTTKVPTPIRKAVRKSVPDAMTTDCLPSPFRYLKLRKVEKALHKFSTTQFDLPEPEWSEIVAMGAVIPDDELAESGRETDAHITVLFGL